jgi:hypothetical protein
MTTKGTQRNRHRTPPIDAETLALFVEHEKTPRRRRDTDTVNNGDRELAGDGVRVSLQRRDLMGRLAGATC